MGSRECGVRGCEAGAGGQVEVGRGGGCGGWGWEVAAAGLVSGEGRRGEGEFVRGARVVVVGMVVMKLGGGWVSRVRC